MKNVRAVTEPDVLTIKVDMSDAVKEFEEEKAEQLRSQWEESEWYLGEARASESRLERQLDEVREAYLTRAARPDRNVVSATKPTGTWVSCV